MKTCSSQILLDSPLHALRSFFPERNAADNVVEEGRGSQCDASVSLSHTRGHTLSDGVQMDGTFFGVHLAKYFLLLGSCKQITRTIQREKERDECRVHCSMVERIQKKEKK